MFHVKIQRWQVCVSIQKIERMKKQLTDITSPLVFEKEHANLQKLKYFSNTFILF